MTPMPDWRTEVWDFYEALPKVRFAQEICRLMDLPPWAIGLAPRPRFARLRWALRRWFPRLVWQ